MMTTQPGYATRPWQREHIFQEGGHDEDEFHEALRHGELLLMVDVSRDCVEDVEELMRRRHPEAVAGGSGWTPDVFGV